LFAKIDAEVESFVLGEFISIMVCIGWNSRLDIHHRYPGTVQNWFLEGWLTGDSTT